MKRGKEKQPDQSASVQAHGTTKEEVEENRTRKSEVHGIATKAMKKGARAPGRGNPRRNKKHLARSDTQNGDQKNGNSTNRREKKGKELRSTPPWNKNAERKYIETGKKRMEEAQEAEDGKQPQMRKRKTSDL